MQAQLQLGGQKQSLTPYSEYLPGPFLNLYPLQNAAVT